MSTGSRGYLPSGGNVGEIFALDVSGHKHWQDMQTVLDGKDDYELAVGLGFVGTREEWRLFLNGAGGLNGKNVEDTIETYGYDDIKPFPILRQVDLHIPGRFAAEVTDGALQSVGKDYFVWGCEDVILTALKARCVTADSGTAQPVLQLFVDGVPVGDMFSPAVDHWAYIALPRVKMQYGHSVEIAVVNTGDIKDASDMHVIIMSEYVPPEIQAPSAPGGGGTSQSDGIFTETISGPYFPVESLDLLVGQTADTAVRFPPGTTDKSGTYSIVGNIPGSDIATVITYAAPNGNPVATVTGASAGSVTLKFETGDGKHTALLPVVVRASGVQTSFHVAGDNHGSCLSIEYSEDISG